MFTKEQESFLATLADNGLAEQVAAKANNLAMAQEQVVAEARYLKEIELHIEADKLIADGLVEFETKTVPIITSDVVV